MRRLQVSVGARAVRGTESSDMSTAPVWCEECADAVPHRYGECFGQRRPRPEDRDKAGDAETWIKQLATIPEAGTALKQLETDKEN